MWKRNPNKGKQKDYIAERVSQGMKLTPISKEMGISRQRVSQLWAEICYEVGEPVR